MENVINSVEPARLKVRRKAISYVPGNYRYDANTGDLEVWGVPDEVSNLVDRMAEQRGIPNGEMLGIIINHAILGEQLAEERKAAEEWLARQKQDITSESSSAPVQSRTQQALRSEAGQSKSATPQSSKGIPFMITKVMKSRLEKLGYAPKDIDEMTPAQAHQILEGQQKRRKRQP